MLEVLRKRWFLISLAVLIPGGLSLGLQLSLEQVRLLKTIIPPRAVTALVLFLMSLSLNSRQLKASLRAPGPVVWAATINYGFIPLAGLALMPVQLLPDFQYGLMIAAAVPCTMAAASVWTRKAGGNDAVSLLVTAVTNGLCFLITPFWLNLATSGGVRLDVGAMIWRLVLAVLIPTIVGQLLRLSSAVAVLADTHKTKIGVAAQACILTIVFSAACEAGTRLGGIAGSSILVAALVVWGSCLLLHAAAMILGLLGGRLFGFAWADLVAVAFAGSQKTLPIGVLLATDVTMFGNPDLLGGGTGIPFAVFPMLMYHTSQLFIDTVVADRFARSGGASPRETPAEAAATVKPPSL